MLKILGWFAWGSLVVAILGSSYFYFQVYGTGADESECALLENQDLIKICIDIVRTEAKWLIIWFLASGIVSAVTLGFMYCVLKNLENIQRQLIKS